MSPIDQRDLHGRQSAAPATVLPPAGTAAWRWLKARVGINAAIVIFVAALIGVLWNTVFGMLRTEREDTVRAAIDRNDNLAIAFEQYTIRTIESADAAIKSLIRAHVGSGRTMVPEKTIAEFTIDDKAIIGVVLADERGAAKTNAYSGKSVASLNVADREHFRVHIERDRGSVFVGKPVVGRVTGKWTIPVTRRINKPDGSFGGVAMALIEPRRFTDVLHEARLRPFDIISLVGLDGITRARLTGTTESWGQDISKGRLFAERAIRPAGHYAARGAVDNVPRFFSYRTLADYQVMVTVGHAEADVLAEFYRRQTRYFWAAGLASAVIAAFAALLILAFARQSKALTALADSETRYRDTFEHAAVGIVHTSMERRFLRVNQKFCDMLGYARDELMAISSRDIAHADDRRANDKMQARLVAGEIDTISSEARFIHKDGSTIWVNRSVSLVRDGAGAPLYFIRVVEDITDRKQAQDQLVYLAQYDALTGLPNRNLLRDRLALAIARAQRQNQPLALMYVDLDRFKEVNDTLGHTAGDEVLQAAAGLFRVSLREVDTIARLSGDEFTILLEDVAQSGYVGIVAEKIKTAFATPFIIHGREFFITASIGIALCPQDALAADALLKAADIAMYQAKQAGRNGYVFYAAEMDAQADERQNREVRLRHAIERRELLLHYQPKVETGSGKLVGVEALIRWNSPELGMVLPADFLPLAEETGLIEPIGEWVLKTACAQSVAWQALGLPPVLMAVNLSPRQLRQKNLVPMVAAALRESGLGPGLLELEITESVIMENIHQNMSTLKELQRLGVALSIDDFGSGSSSLAYLTKLPVRALKIDRSFIVDILDDADSMALVAAILTMARSLKLKVIAEGVETRAQEKLLRLLRCDEIQGFLISAPLSASAMTDFFAQPPQGDAAEIEMQQKAGLT